MDMNELNMIEMPKVLTKEKLNIASSLRHPSTEKD